MTLGRGALELATSLGGRSRSLPSRAGAAGSLCSLSSAEALVGAGQREGGEEEAGSAKTAGDEPRPLGHPEDVSDFRVERYADFGTGEPWVARAVERVARDPALLLDLMLSALEG